MRRKEGSVHSLHFDMIKCVTFARPVTNIHRAAHLPSQDPILMEYNAPTVEVTRPQNARVDFSEYGSRWMVQTVSLALSTIIVWPTP